METHFLYAIPIPLLFGATLLGGLAAIEGGRRLGVYRRKSGGESPGPVGSAVGATLGLLAFILAMVSVGYQFGLDSDRRSIGAILLAVTFSTVLVTIADLDDGATGVLRISQSPIQNLHANIAAE